MKSHKLSGCGTALVTPFRNGEVDYPAYEAMVRRQVKAGINFLVPLGTTAETPTLEEDEKREIMRLTRKNAQDKILIAGAGTNSLHQSIKNMRLLEQADMYLMVVPYYNKPTQRGMYEYFKALASETDKDIVLYNVPGRTGANMSAATTLKLSEIPNIVAIKEASGNLSQIRTIIHERPEGFSVLSGNDDQTLEIMIEGGDGVISVASNIVPKEMVDFVEAAAKGNIKKATSYFRRLIGLFDACFIESNPIPVKAALASMGLCENEMRLPLVPCEESTYNRIVEAIKQVEDSKPNIFSRFL